MAVKHDGACERHPQYERGCHDSQTGERPEGHPAMKGQTLHLTDLYGMTWRSVTNRGSRLLRILARQRPAGRGADATRGNSRKRLYARRS